MIGLQLAYVIGRIDDFNLNYTINRQSIGDKGKTSTSWRTFMDNSLHLSTLSEKPSEIYQTIRRSMRNALNKSPYFPPDFLKGCNVYHHWIRTAVLLHIICAYYQ
ncbi:hypothetical protein CDAR_196241 [Caerostris darwini]|uniref:Uncharacterized protein n=1 Tax=Caerostris darwini TaxID=1538125 RepID=A0AAV4PWX5_9ARAC|nr:hypothetical protein CDAR_196241 [Caerostris darwini]